MQKKFLVLLLILVYSGTGLKAAKITQDESIRLDQTTSSQTINIGLDSFPDKLVKKDGSIKNRNIPVKFKLSKKDKKNFKLNPKNGKVKIKIQDGNIIPASLSITAKNLEDQKFYSYSIRAPKKLRKRLIIESFSSTISIGDKFRITGKLVLPELDQEKFKASTEASLNNTKRNIIFPIFIGGLTVGTAVIGGIGAVVVITPVAGGGTSGTGSGVTTDGDSFTADIDKNAVEEDEKLVVQITNEDGSSTLTSFVLGDDIEINARSQYVFDTIAASGTDLNDISIDEIKAIARAVDDLPLDENLDSIEKIKASLDAQYGETFRNILENLGNDASLIPETSSVYNNHSIRTKLGYTVGSLTTQTFASEVNVNNLVYSLATNGSSFDLLTNRIFDNSYIGTYSHAPGTLLPVLDLTKTLELLDQPKLVDIVINGTRKQNIQNTFNFIADIVNGNLTTSTGSYGSEFAIASNTGLIIGAPKTIIRKVTSLDNDPQTISNTIGLDIEFEKTDASEIDTEETASSKLEDKITWILSIGTALNKDGQHNIESTLVKCDAGTGTRNCDGELIAMKLNSIEGQRSYTLNSSYIGADTSSVEYFENNAGISGIDYRWNESDLFNSLNKPNTDGVNFTNNAYFASKSQSSSSDTSSDNSSVFSFVNSSDFANYVGDYKIFGYGYEVSPSVYSAFNRSGDLQLELGESGEPQVSFEITDNLSSVNSQPADLEPINSTTSISYKNDSTELQGVVIDIEASSHGGTEVQRCLAIEGNEVLVCRFYDLKLDFESQTNINEPVHMGIYFAVKKS